MYSARSTLTTTTEVPLSKAPEPPTCSLGAQHKWLPTAPGVCSRWVCVHCCVCTLDGLIAEHKFRVWVTILGHMSRHFTFLMQCLASYNMLIDWLCITWLITLCVNYAYELTIRSEMWLLKMGSTCMTWSFSAWWLVHHSHTLLALLPGNLFQRQVGFVHQSCAQLVGHAGRSGRLVARCPFTCLSCFVLFWTLGSAGAASLTLPPQVAGALVCCAPIRSCIQLWRNKVRHSSFKSAFKYKDRWGNIWVHKCTCISNIFTDNIKHKYEHTVYIHK